MLYIILGIAIACILFLGYRYSNLTTLLKSKNQELTHTKTQLDAEHQKHQEFISALSQELRTPLYGIMGLTNILMEEHPNLQHNKSLKSLKFSNDYLLTLINNVVQVNKLNDNESADTNTSFDIQDMTQNIVNSFSYATSSNDNALVFNYDKEIPEILIGNPAILSQILMNLISNALRFTKNGAIVFSVNMIKKKAQMCTVSFRIQHDGNELSKEDEKSIFQEFINIDKAKKTYLGSGFNGRIVRQLAASINGEIVLQNDTKEGSEYAFLLEMEMPDTVVTQQSPTNTKKRILVVDDNKLNLLVADKILSKENFECTTCDNGFDAIELAENNTYDIILMDINMPKLNGIGTTKRIRKFNTETPIIALTAVDVTQLNRQIMQAGLNDYILKPYGKKSLLEIIDKYVNTVQ